MSLLRFQKRNRRKDPDSDRPVSPGGFRLFRKQKPSVVRRNVRRPQIDASPVTADTEALEPPSVVSGSGRFGLRLRGILRFVLLLACLAGLVFGGIRLYSLITTTSYFAVKFVEIRGNQRLTNQQVQEASGFSPGDNMFSLDFLSIQERLSQHPWIEAVTVQQRLPGTVILDIVERTVVMMVLFDVPYLVDSAGTMFKRWQLEDPIPDVILTGLTREALMLYPDEVERTILEAIAFQEAWRTAGLHRKAPLAEIHRELGDGFSVTAGKDPLYVRMGQPPYRQKLQRLARLLDRIRQGGKQPAIIYLDNERRPDRITVRMKDELDTSP